MSIEQITGIATAVLALLAWRLTVRLRSDKAKLKFFVARHATHNLSVVPGGGSTFHEIKLAIVNVGVLPVRIRSVLLQRQRATDGPWGELMDPYLDNIQQQGTQTLKHGDEVVFKSRIRRELLPWEKLPRLWWLRRKIWFIVDTSLGTHRVRIPMRVARWIDRRVLNP